MGLELAVGSADGCIAFLDADILQSLKVSIKLHNSQITHIACALNGTVLVTGGGWGTGIKLTDVASGRNIASFDGVVGSFPMQPLAVSRDGRRLATGSVGREAVKLWDTASYQELLTLEGQRSHFTDTAFSPDGNVLGSLSAEGFLHVWTAPSWPEIKAAEKKLESRQSP